MKGKGINQFELPDGTEEFVQFADHWSQSSWVKQRECEWQAGTGLDYPKPQIVFYSNDNRTFDSTGELIVDYGKKVQQMVSEFYGVNMALTGANLWYYMSPKDKIKRQSQSWHRDPPIGNRVPVKAFLWCHAINEANGPFQYIMGSRPLEKYWPKSEKLDAYPPEEEIKATVDNKDIVTCTTQGVQLTVAETIGLHRGGNVHPGSSRLCGNWVFYQAA